MQERFASGPALLLPRNQAGLLHDCRRVGELFRRSRPANCRANLQEAWSAVSVRPRAIHLGLICNEYPPARHGGIGSCCHDLAEGMVAAGHHVTVIGTYSATQMKGDIPSKATINGVDVLRLAALPQWLPFSLRGAWERVRLGLRLRAEQQRRCFDVIENIDYEGWLPLGGPRCVPVVARLHGTNALYDQLLGRTGHRFQYWLEVRSLLKADFWIGVSQFALDETLRACGVKEHDGIVVHNGVDTDFFCPDSTVRTERGLIVFVNSLNPRKGPDKLIDAAQLLFPRHPEAKLALVGNVNVGGERGKAYMSQLRGQIKPEFRDRIFFSEKRLDRVEVLAYLRRAQVCCFPSRAEMFAIAPLEAMAVGAATVYSKIRPGYEAIEEGVSGLLCDASDPADIAAKIESVLRDPVLGRRLGAAGRRRVLERFDKSRWISRNLDVFESFIERYRSRQEGAGGVRI